MKISIFLNIFLELISLSFNIIPLWNLKNSSVDLLLTSGSNTFIIYEKRQDDLHALLNKDIKKNNQVFNSQNYILMKEGEINQPTLWEDIHYSAFIDGHFICPKGNFF